jgi:mycoredoxin
MAEGTTDASGTANEREVVVYVTSWCGSCRAALRFLEEHSIAYVAVDIDEDEAAAERVMSLNRGNRSVPTIMVDGVHALTEPMQRDLRQVFL